LFYVQFLLELFHELPVTSLLARAKNYITFSVADIEVPGNMQVFFAALHYKSRRWTQDHRCWGSV